MTGLRLADLVEIVLWLIASVAIGLSVILAIYLWPQFVQFTRATRRRYVRVSWNDFVNNIADDMSSDEEWEEDENDGDGVAATMTATQQQSIAIQQNERNALLLQAKAEALAAMVEAGLTTETKGLQIVFGVRPSSTNPRYIAARDALHAEMAKRTTPIAGRPTSAKFAPR